MHRVIRGVSQEPLPITFMNDNLLTPGRALPLAKSNSTALKLHTVYVHRTVSRCVALTSAMSMEPQ